MLTASFKAIMIQLALTCDDLVMGPQNIKPNQTFLESSGFVPQCHSVENYTRAYLVCFRDGCDHHLRSNHASQSVPDASWQPPRWPDWHLEAVSNFWAGPILYVHALVPSSCKLLHMSSRSQAQTLVSTGPSTHYGSCNSKKDRLLSDHRMLSGLPGLVC